MMLGEAPVYLYAESPEALEKLLAHAADNVSELSFRLERLFAGKTVLILRNQSGKSIKLKLAQVETSGPAAKKVIPLGDEFTLAPGEVKSVEKPVGGESVAFTVETAAGRRYTAAALSCIGEGNGNPLQYCFLENPMDRGAWQATVQGVAKSRTWRLALSY